VRVQLPIAYTMALDASMLQQFEMMLQALL
jgi:hypothetical protein